MNKKRTNKMTKKERERIRETIKERQEKWKKYEKV